MVNTENFKYVPFTMSDGLFMIGFFPFTWSLERIMSKSLPIHFIYRENFQNYRYNMNTNDILDLKTLW